MSQDNTNSSKPSSILGSAKVPIHARVSPQSSTRIDGAHQIRSTDKPDKSARNLEALILQIVTRGGNPQQSRANFAQLAISESGVAGVCYLRPNPAGLWRPDNKNVAIGRVPDPESFAAECSEQCDDVAANLSIVSSKIKALGDLTCLLAPLRNLTPNNDDQTRELILIVLKNEKYLVSVSRNVEKIVSGLRVCVGRSQANDSLWQVQTLSAIVDIVSKIESQSNIKKSSETLANQLANHFKCDRAAIGLYEKGRIRLKAISGTSKIDKSSTTRSEFIQTMVESSLRDGPAVFPAINDKENYLAQAHRQLAAASQTEAVYSQPLETEEGEYVGVLVFTGRREILQSPLFSRFNDAAAIPIASALRIASKVKRGLLGRSIDYVKEKTTAIRLVLVAAAIIGLTLLMMLPITYRVRCNCIAEPVSRRFAVAPFDGQIVSGHAEPGDRVTKDQLLAEMDGRTVRWELSGVSAERAQSLRTRRMELSERNIPKTMLAELEYDRLVAEENVLEYRREHLQIKSPADGVVLSGSLERAEAASVSTGQVLFEIGPIKPLRLEVAIPASDISHVEPGLNTKIWIDGQEDRPIEGQILKIHPRSETRDAKNVFIAEIEFPNEDERLRPGMKGSVRVDCSEKSLGWSLFHKPINWVRSRIAFY